MRVIEEHSVFELSSSFTEAFFVSRAAFAMATRTSNVSLSQGTFSISPILIALLLDKLKE